MKTPELFADIRPYQDDEVAEVLTRLVQDPELLEAIARFRFPRCPQYMAAVLHGLIGWRLKKKVANIRTIHDLQLQVADYMQHMVNTTTDGFSVSGLDNLSQDQTYLFVGNHRDIAMDPGFINLALHQAGRETLRIAIGDNLIKKAYVTDLMRLNKSFIVKRSAKGVRELMQAMNTLSAYIHYSLFEEKHSIWIAQREGRAKDGIDVTDPAIIKMFFMHEKRRKDAEALNFTQTIKKLQIVPVSIAYEYDPCALLKARELSTQDYAKAEFEDMQSIALGITGYKGRVHVHFSQPLKDNYQDAEQVAETIDKAILKGYQLFPSHYLAYADLGEDTQGLESVFAHITEAQKANFARHKAQIPEAYVSPWLAMYANPVRRLMAAKSHS